jgi:hypothetical protein
VSKRIKIKDEKELKLITVEVDVLPRVRPPPKNQMTSAYTQSVRDDANIKAIVRDLQSIISKQRQRLLRQLVENLRHVYVTNMSRHIDKFEWVCGQMAHNNPTKPPTEEHKIDWFLESVTECT